MACDRCESNDCCSPVLFSDNVILTLCYSCTCLYDKQIHCLVQDKGTCYFNPYTGHSYEKEEPAQPATIVPTRIKAFKNINVGDYVLIDSNMSVASQYNYRTWYQVTKKTDTQVAIDRQSYRLNYDPKRKVLTNVKFSAIGGYYIKAADYATYIAQQSELPPKDYYDY